MSMTETRPTRHPSYVRQLIEAFVVLGAGISLLVPPILFWSSWQQARAFTEHTAAELVAILAEDARYALLVGSPQDARTVVSTILKFPDVIGASVVDASGKTLADQDTADVRMVHRTIQVEAAVVAAEQAERTLAAESVREHPLGRVVLTLSLDRAWASSLQSARASILQLGILTLLLGMAVWRRSRRMLSPLAALVRFLDSPGSQDRDARLPTPPRSSPAEVHRIQAAIAATRARLAKNHRQLLAYANELEARVAARTQALRQALDAAEQASRAKTLFLANVSHELRTPLQAIILHTRLIDRAQLGLATEPLQVILRASQQLLDLIEQLLNLARVEAGHPLEVTYQRVAIGALLEEIAATVRATLAPRNRLELDLPDADFTVVSDRTRLTQVFYNLIRNADKFTDGGSIRLALARIDDPQRALITVTDPGIGIQPAELERIFEPFYQGANGVNGAVASGIGLGLPLIRHLLDALGGHLEVASEPGSGTCFRVEIPVSPATPMALSAPPAALDMDARAPVATDHGGTRLLLAEDEALIRAPLAVFLREAGFRVDECVDGTAALALLEPNAHRYAAVILDHRLPGCLGVDILARLRASGHATLPVVILTGDDRAPLQAAIARLGAHLMVKPVLPERLIQTLATLIDPPVTRIARRSEEP